METYESRKCLICNSTISDDNPDGVGFGCRQNVVTPSVRDTFFKFHYLDFYIWEVEVWKSNFIEMFKNKKFRSEFRKNFFASISNAERISKKQLNIIQDWIQWEDGLKWKELDEYCWKERAFRMSAFKPETEEERVFFEEQINIRKIEYLSKRKTDKDE